MGSHNEIHHKTEASGWSLQQVRGLIDWNDVGRCSEYSDATQSQQLVSIVANNLLSPNLNVGTLCDLYTMAVSHNRGHKWIAHVTATNGSSSAEHRTGEPLQCVSLTRYHITPTSYQCIPAIRPQGSDRLRACCL